MEGIRSEAPDIIKQRLDEEDVDNPQEQGINVAPLNVEVRYQSTGSRRKI
jgi:hypothetical protein